MKAVLLSLPLGRLALYVAASVGLCGAGLATSAFAQPAGSLDAGFTLTRVLGDRIISISPQDDGNIVIGGTISEVDGVGRSSVARVLPDGELDPGFVPPDIQSYNTLTDSTVTTLNPEFKPVVFTTAIQPDGKVLVGGSFYFINGQPGYGGLVRVNTDGSLDTSFHAPRFSGNVFSVLALSNGDVLVGGDFDFVDTKHRNCLVKLDSQGGLIKSFAPGAFAGTLAAGTLSAQDAASTFPTVHAMALQSDGKVIIAGIFTKIAGTARRAIARLNQDGSVDGSFVPDASFNPPPSGQGSAYSADQVLSLAVQSDGKLIVGGEFRDAGTLQELNSITRLNSDGSLDPSFNPGGLGTLYTGSTFFTAIAPTVNAILLQPDGKIILGGEFVGYNGVSTNFMTRLNSDGTLDTSFTVGTGPSDIVLALARQPDGTVLVGGLFIAFDGVSRPLVARVNTVADVPPAVVVSIAATAKKAFEPGKVKGVFTVTRAGGNPTAAIEVKYSVGGDAVPGTDYKTLPGDVTIPGGSSSATIKVKPTGPGPAGSREKVQVTLASTAAYAVPSNPHAAVIIIEGVPPPPPIPAAMGD